VKTSSCKAKGRFLQKLVRDLLLAIGAAFGLEQDDIKSTGMGQSGVDVQYSPAARRLFGRHAWESKNVESLNVVTTFWAHAAKYPDEIPILVHKKNRTEPLVTVKLSYFIELLNRSIVNAK
jgi:hypothetical protein